MLDNGRLERHPTRRPPRPVQRKAPGARQAKDGDFMQPTADHAGVGRHFQLLSIGLVAGG